MANTVLIMAGESKFFLSIDKTLNPKIIRKKAKVTLHTYGDELLERLLSAVFCGLHDLERELILYYQPEYQSLQQLMHYKYGLSQEDIVLLRRFRGSKRLIARGDLFCGGDAGVTNWLKDEGSQRILGDLLNIERTSDEN